MLTGVFGSVKWLGGRRGHYFEAAIVVLVIALAAGRRMQFITEHPLWVDESESSINALSILEHGVPVDHYLGLPIYENTLVKRWPGNPEYEFKDISYSDRGLATYHGWIPLYAIAASFKLAGITPDRAADRPPVRTVDDFKRRSKFARLPAVLFSTIFLALCYWGGKEIFGRDAGWAALLAGCLHQTQMDVSLTARYYSATVALSTAAVLCLWFILRRGAWKHFAVGAVVFALLFYTHLVTFAAGIAVFCLAAVYLLKNRAGSLPKLALFCGILAVLTIPWMLATGFLDGLGSVPAARTLLSLPRDLFVYPAAQAHYFVFFGGLFLLMVGLWLGRFSLPAKWSTPLRKAFPPAVLLLTWIACAYCSFILLMPAASFFPERLNLSYWGPMLLLGAISCAALARAFAPRHGTLATPVLAILLLTATGHEVRGLPSPDSGHGWKELADLNDYLKRQPVTADTRLFAAPNEHLTLAFYTGRPFQSIAPIRKSFLDAYPGDIVYVDRANFSPSQSDCQNSYKKNCASASSRTLPYRALVEATILGQPTGVAQRETEYRRPRSEDTDGIAAVDLPIFRGFKISDADQWRAIFFYRFVNPLARSGHNWNYAQRLRGASVDLLTNANWAIYHSSFAGERRSAGVDFRLLP